MNCQITGVSPSTYLFSSPSTSYTFNFSNFDMSSYQSWRVPPRCAFWMPQPPMPLSQSKYFLKLFIIIAVEKVFSKRPLELKLHWRFQVTPSLVFFLMASMMRSKNQSQLVSSQLRVYIDSFFLPWWLTKALRSSSALSSTYLVNQSMMTSQRSSGFTIISPWFIQASQKQSKNPLAAEWVSLQFSEQVRSFLFFAQNYSPFCFVFSFGCFLSRFCMGIVLQPSCTVSLLYLGYLFYLPLSWASCSHNSLRKLIINITLLGGGEYLKMQQILVDLSHLSKLS